MPTNQPQSTEPKLIDYLRYATRTIISTGYKDAPQERLPNGRLRQRLPPVRYSIQPQTLELFSFADFHPNYVGTISLAKLFHFDTYECALTGLS
jgi:hypothetical protein